MSRTRHPPAVLVALLALVVALCGTSLAGYAAGKSSGDKIIKKHSLSGNRLKPGTVTGDEVNESTLATVPSAATAATAHSAETVPAPVFHPLTTVTGYLPDTTTTSRPLGYRIDASGFVHLQGAVKKDTALFMLFMVLPPGVRPSDARFAVATNTGPGMIAISTIGEVTIVTGGSGAISLEGVTFYPDH